jgi:hypothetical protein
MVPPALPSTEWRVTCEHNEAAWLSWRVRVFVRAIKPGDDPGPWRVVRDVTYSVPKGQVKNSYWKDLIRAAAQ